MAIKQNDAFARHQGNSLEDDDVKSLWQKLFVNEAERDIPEDYTHSQKNEVLCFLCELFMVRTCMALNNQLLFMFQLCMHAYMRDCIIINRPFCRNHLGH